jgi:hypothetical protein
MKSRVKLQVSERQFVTTKKTLISESSYFLALISGRWSNQDNKGCYFIDSDPELFAEVLRYLRSGNFPLYYDPNKQKYNYAKYAALLGEAQYFGITKLKHKVMAGNSMLEPDPDCPFFGGTVLSVTVIVM